MENINFKAFSILPFFWYIKKDENEIRVLTLGELHISWYIASPSIIFCDVDNGLSYSIYFRRIHHGPKKSPCTHDCLGLHTFIFLVQQSNNKICI